MKSLREIFDLTDKWALITGGQGHLAGTMAKTLAGLGANVILVDLDIQKLEQAKQNLLKTSKSKVKIFVCNLEEEKQRDDLIMKIISEHQNLDVLINNAAFVGSSKLEGWTGDIYDQSIHTWRRALEVNLTSVFHLCQGLMPLLEKSSSGSIINIGSIYGEHGPDWSLYEDTDLSNPAAYSASKGGLMQLTRWLATTVAPKVRVNAISPGGIERQQPDIFRQRYIARTPMKRLATEDDFSGITAYLATNASSYVTGQVIRVDGGWGVW
jgi:NAD(P)-dependent dehydrogenase (short-subunit alcohol dehydrogenase family)